VDRFELSIEPGRHHPGRNAPAATAKIACFSFAEWHKR